MVGGRSFRINYSLLLFRFFYFILFILLLRGAWQLTWISGSYFKQLAKDKLKINKEIYCRWFILQYRLKNLLNYMFSDRCLVLIIFHAFSLVMFSVIHLFVKENLDRKKWINEGAFNRVILECVFMSFPRDKFITSLIEWVLMSFLRAILRIDFQITCSIRLNSSTQVNDLMILTYL